MYFEQTERNQYGKMRVREPDQVFNQNVTFTVHKKRGNWKELLRYGEETRELPAVQLEHLVWRHPFQPSEPDGSLKPAALVSDDPGPITVIGLYLLASWVGTILTCTAMLERRVTERMARRRALRDAFLAYWAVWDALDNMISRITSDLGIYVVNPVINTRGYSSLIQCGRFCFRLTWAVIDLVMRLVLAIINSVHPAALIRRSYRLLSNYEEYELYVNREWYMTWCWLIGVGGFFLYAFVSFWTDT